MASNAEIAKNVLKEVGGKENIVQLEHCFTRLRFTLKDKALADINKIKKISGVAQCQDVGGQLQVVIGLNVNDVYDLICQEGGFEKSRQIEENLDLEPEKPKEKKTVKYFIDRVLNYMSTSMAAIIPLLLGCAFFQAINALGSVQFGLFSSDSNLYILCDFVYNAGFYFLPIYLGYSTVKYFGGSPILGALMGGILISPGFVGLEGTAFTVFGIPCATNNYSSTVVPIMLIAPLLAFIEKKVNKILPKMIRNTFTPFFTMIITLPFALCVLAPLGGWMGELIGDLFVVLSGSKFSALATVIIGGVFCFLIMTGMHQAVAVAAVLHVLEYGSESVIMPGVMVAAWASWGLSVGAWIYAKRRKMDERDTFFGYIISAMIGGINEPILFGICLKYKKTMIYMMVAGALAGLWCAISHVSVYLLGFSNIFILSGYLIGGTANFVNACIAWVIAVAAAAIQVVIFGLGKES